MIVTEFVVLFDSNHPLVLQQLPRVVAIIAEAFNKECVSTDSDVAKRMVHIIKQIQVSNLQSQYNSFSIMTLCNEINLLFVCVFSAKSRSVSNLYITVK